MAHYCRGSSTCNVRLPDDVATCSGHSEPIKDDIQIALTFLEAEDKFWKQMIASPRSGLRAQAITALRRALLRLSAPFPDSLPFS